MNHLLKNTALACVGILSIMNANAGTPDQDPNVRALRRDFTSALSTNPIGDWEFQSDWICTSYDAFRDDDYSEPDMTFRFSKGKDLNQVVSNGTIIFKDLQMTDHGITSVKENEAYSGKPEYLNLRPHFIYERGNRGACDTKNPNCVDGKMVKEVTLIGEVSVDPSILADMATYYGYDRPFTGVPAVSDPSKTVYYYMTCSVSNDKTTTSASEDRNSSWSIPAENRRQWPNRGDEESQAQ